jgi:hypothetical protein
MIQTYQTIYNRSKMEFGGRGLNKMKMHQFLSHGQQNMKYVQPFYNENNVSKYYLRRKFIASPLSIIENVPTGVIQYSVAKKIHMMKF